MRDDGHCVHCPHCDHHLSTRGEVREIMRRSGAPPPGGAWTACPCCAKPILVAPDGAHLAPTKAQIEALPPEGLRGVERMVGLARMAGMSRGRGDTVH